MSETQNHTEMSNGPIEEDNVNKNENWMSHLPTDLLTKPLNRIAIPGSHDSFTYSLDKNGPVANDESDTLQSLGSLPCVKNIIYNWSVTQHLTVTEQLNAGIRYFDFRISHPAKPASETEIKVLHGLYGAVVWSIVDEINTFLNAHPREVVLLDWNHFYNFSAELHQNALDTLQNTFGSKLCPRLSADKLTLQFMWSKAYQVVLLYESKDIEVPPVFWRNDDISSPWANSDSRDELFKYLAEHLKQRPLNEFYVVQGIETPEAKDIAAHLTGSLEKNLASPCTEALVKWLTDNKQDFKPLLNIVFCDFVEKYDIIDTVLGFNTD